MKHKVKRGINIYSRTGEYIYMNDAKNALEFFYEISQTHQINYVYMDDKNGGVYIVLNPEYDPDPLMAIIMQKDFYICDQILKFEDGFTHIDEPGRVVVFVDDRNRRKNKIPKNITPKLRASIISRDGAKCILCNKSDGLEVHHIIPVSIIKRLGLSEFFNVDKDNLTTLCRSCNIGIGDRLNQELIDIYIEKFKEKSHPNNGVCEILNKIRDIQY